MDVADRPAIHDGDRLAIAWPTILAIAADVASAARGLRLARNALGGHTSTVRKRQARAIRGGTDRPTDRAMRTTVQAPEAVRYEAVR